MEQRLTTRFDSPTGRDQNPEGLMVAGELRLVQLRLRLVALSSVLLGGVITGLLVLALIPEAAGHFGSAIRSASMLKQAGLLGALLTATALTMHLARLIVRPAQRLDTFIREYSRLFETAQLHALQDSLTGLGNHRAFQEEFDRQLSLSRRHGVGVALAILDLDDLKRINDTAGHATGDEALLELSRRMRGTLRAGDCAFRIGGDEFAILLPHTTADEARVAVTRLLAATLEPLPGSPYPRGISFSAGIASAPQTATTRPELFDQADEALYAAKRQGRTIVKVFEQSLVSNRLVGPALVRATDALVAVLDGRDLRPVYQPIIDMASGRVIGVEGLVRPGAGSGFNNPGELFETAGASGRTFELDQVCIETVLAGAEHLPLNQWLAINVSPATLETPEFSVAWVVAAAASVGLVPGRLALELTEREVVREPTVIRQRLGAFRAAGFRIAIDDVGAGNAGLRLLSQIHFDIVKIDLSLVQEGARNDSSREVLRAMIGLATRWGAMTIAEGVETPAQLQMVSELGFTAAQGYLLGRPGSHPDTRSVDLAALVHEADMSAVLATVRSSFGGRVAGPGNQLRASQRLAATGGGT